MHNLLLKNSFTEKSVKLFSIYTLLIPLGDLSAQPICPLVDALAGSCGYGDDGYVRIELFDILSALIKIKVKVRHDVDLINEENIADREHKRILKGLVVTLGNGEDHRVFDGARVKLRRAYGLWLGKD